VGGASAPRHLCRSNAAPRGQRLATVYVGGCPSVGSVDGGSSVDLVQRRSVLGVVPRPCRRVTHRWPRRQNHGRHVIRWLARGACTIVPLQGITAERRHQHLARTAPTRCCPTFGHPLTRPARIIELVWQPIPVRRHVGVAHDVAGARGARSATRHGHGPAAGQAQQPPGSTSKGRHIRRSVWNFGGNAEPRNSSSVDMARVVALCRSWQNGRRR
jgi:hypothetical protein